MAAAYNPATTNIALAPSACPAVAGLPISQCGGQVKELCKMQFEIFPFLSFAKCNFFARCVLKDCLLCRSTLAGLLARLMSTVPITVSAGDYINQSLRLLIFTFTFTILSFSFCTFLFVFSAEKYVCSQLQWMCQCLLWCCSSSTSSPCPSPCTCTCTCTCSSPCACGRRGGKETPACSQAQGGA